MLRRFWLFFAQAVTVVLALLFVVSTLKPDWLPHDGRGGFFGRPDAARAVNDDDAATPTSAPPSSPAGSHAAADRQHARADASYADAAHRAMPAVVNVFSTKGHAASKRDLRLNDPLYRYLYGNKGARGSRHPGNRGREERSPASNLGSGVIVNAEGYILTNQHVVEGADEIEVALADGRKTSAQVIGADPDTDLAVLKINLPNLPTIALGHIEDHRVGDVVLAIGNPFAVGQTVTMGIISALGRNHLGITPFENFIQTDAAINPGNSGGALVDVEGNLIGINTAIYSRSGGSLGIGFATPVSTARMVLDSIIQTGSVTRGWIGVEPQDITPEIAQSFHLKQVSGAIVAGVLQGAPADKGGVRPGDIIVGVNDQPVTETVSLLNVIAQITPGTDATLHVVRRNKPVELTVSIGKRPTPSRTTRVENEDE
ncbi:MAG: S1C family serine protease [Janthinobacterium lividum]